MAKTKHIILIFALILLSTQGVISEEAQISNTREASCVLQITTDLNVMPMDYDTFESLIHTSGVTGKAARDIIGVSHDKVRVIIGTQKLRHLTTEPFTFNLSVRLEENAKPAANEFLKALIENLKQSLINAYGAQKGIINEQYEVALDKYNDAQDKITQIKEEPAIRIYPMEEDDIDHNIKRDLEKKVDLSNLGPEMSFDDVLNIIANSVDPPLQIQPNWRDLADLPDIQPTTPVDMVPLKNVKVSAALETLLANLSTPDFTIGYAIKDRIIIIASKDALPQNLIASIYDISGLLINGRTTSNLIKAIKETIEPESWYNENITTVSPAPIQSYGGYSFTPTPEESGKGKIIDMQGGKISIYNTPEIHKKITDFLTYFPKDIPSESVASIPVNLLFGEQQNLSRQKREIEMEIARLKARQIPLEERIAVISKETISKVENDSVTAELERLIETQSQQLAKIKQGFELGTVSQNDLSIAEEKIIQSKIQLAKRREEIAKDAGENELLAKNEYLSNVIIDLTGKHAELQIVDKQLGEIESQIKAASAINPKVLEYSEAEKAFKEAENNLNKIKDMKENMQYPEVIAIGLE